EGRAQGGRDGLEGGVAGGRRQGELEIGARRQARARAEGQGGAAAGGDLAAGQAHLVEGEGERAAAARDGAAGGRVGRHRDRDAGEAAVVERDPLDPGVGGEAEGAAGRREG